MVLKSIRRFNHKAIIHLLPLHIHGNNGKATGYMRSLKKEAQKVNNRKDKE